MTLKVKGQKAKVKGEVKDETDSFDFTFAL